MSNPVSTKVHVYIGHPCSLCGLTSNNGNYHIETFSGFFTVPVENQCGTCLARIEKRGYSIEKLRKQYCAIHSHIEPIDQIHAGQEMSHWIAESRKIIGNSTGGSRHAHRIDQ